MTADLDALAVLSHGRASLARTRAWLLPGEGREAAIWPEAWIASVTVRVRPELAQGWLAPSWLGAGLVSDGLASLFVAEYARTAFGISYRECGLLLHARLRGRSVVSCVWMVVDDDTAMILGRELLGFPKKLAEISIARREGGASLRVVRRGTAVLELELREALPHTPEPVFARPIVNVWGPPGAPSILLELSVPERVHETARARGVLRTRSTVGDPLAGLELDGEVLEASITTSDVGLAPPRDRWIPPGIRPVGLVSPAWLAAQLPLRTL